MDERRTSALTGQFISCPRGGHLGPFTRSANNTISLAVISHGKRRLSVNASFSSFAYGTCASTFRGGRSYGTFGGHHLLFRIVASINFAGCPDR